MENRIVLLHKKYKIKKLLSSLILLPLVFILFFVKVHSSYKVVCILNCEDVCSYTFSLPYDKSNILDSDFKINYNNKMYNVNILRVDEPYLNNNVAFQDVYIESDIDSYNKVLEVNLIYNEQRIIEKILDVFRRW